MSSSAALWRCYALHCGCDRCCWLEKRSDRTAIRPGIKVLSNSTLTQQKTTTKPGIIAGQLAWFQEGDGSTENELAFYSGVAERVETLL